MESFDGIYLDISRQPGKCRFVNTGIGWKPAAGETFTLDPNQITQAQWSKASRGYQVRLLTKEGKVHQLDNFQLDDYERISKAFSLWYPAKIESKDHSLKGWNWGKADFGKAELTFNVQSRPAFEIPFSEVSNTNLAGKNEVAVELSQQDGDTNGVNGHTNGNAGTMGGARDQLVEMRFYVPGTATKKEKVKKEGSGDEGSGQEGGEEGEEEEQNAAQLFYETLMDKADIGEVAGDVIANFEDILHLTPRGRFEVAMYESFFRLRGKTYDYKIQYDQVKKFMLLPKPDDMHNLIVIGIDPPLRQGQTRYPFLVMQFKREEDIDYWLNMKPEMIEQDYKNRLEPEYHAPISNVISSIFRGLSNKKVTTPSKDYLSYHDQSGVKCSIKANEGHLFMLDRSFMFVPKPATYIPFDSISVIVMYRVGGAVAASRTFDLLVKQKNGPEHGFSNINREEQGKLADFFKHKGLKVQNEMADDSSAVLAKALNDEMGSSDDEEVVARGSADEEDESVDEDFQASEESDVAEEYDSQHESSGADSDAEMQDADGDADGDGESEPDAQERPKKKAKTGK